jgi:Flp pilus assembly protein TadD
LLHYNRGNVLMAMGRMEDAIRGFESAIAIDAQYAEAWNNRGNALLELGRAEEALASFGRALAIDPQYAEAHANRGHALLELEQPEPAMAAFRQALAINPADASTHNGLAMACQRVGNVADALRHFSQALSMEPDFPEARHNDALLRLFEGDFGHAWEGYEARIQLPSYRKHLRKDAATVDRFLRLPCWQGPGQAIPGAVGIWAEQGIGDQILFSTMLPELLATGQRFIYEVDQRLLKAYRRAFPEVDFVALSDPPEERLTAATAALFCGSLPRFFRNRAESFSRQPKRLLVADPQLVARHASRLGEGFKVAVSWRSSRAGWVGRSKSTALAALAPLFAVPGVRWVDVQYGDTTEERASVARQCGIVLTHFDEIDYRDDLEDVLAIIENCDLVITTSNASAHFAGALGKPVWLLYPAERPPFHYWAHRGDHRCLWHPSVEIVTGPGLADWPALLAHAAGRLRQRTA